MFYTTPTDDGAIAVTCDLCYAAVSCPDPWAAATAITHHRCDPDAAITGPEAHGPALDSEPALHLLAGRWMASCPTCGSNSPPPEARPAANGAAATGPARSATRSREK